MPSSSSPTTSWPGTNGNDTQSSKYSEAWPSTSERSEPQMPASRVRTRCHPGPGNSGSSTEVYSSGPSLVAVTGEIADAMRAMPSLRTDRETCSAFTPPPPPSRLRCRTDGPGHPEVSRKRGWTAASTFVLQNGWTGPSGMTRKRGWVMPALRCVERSRSVRCAGVPTAAARSGAGGGGRRAPSTSVRRASHACGRSLRAASRG